jgi:hypothetical protein
VARLAFVGPCAVVLNELDREAANRRQDQCVDETAFVEQEFLDQPNEEKERAYEPEHGLQIRRVFVAQCKSLRGNDQRELNCAKTTTTRVAGN